MITYTYAGSHGHTRPNQTTTYKPLNRSWYSAGYFRTTSMDEIEVVHPTVDKQKFKAVLKNELTGCLKWGCKIYLADTEYHPVHECVAKRVVDGANLSEKKWVPEKHDCDDFAHLLKSAFIRAACTNGLMTHPYAFGIVWGGNPAHAMNFVLTSDGAGQYGLRIIEPQSGTFYKPSDSILDKIYLIIA